MTDDIRLAFAHPSERAHATAPTVLDRISLRDYIVAVEIGAFQLERGTSQRVSFNIVVEVGPVTGPVDDDVDRILSYDSVIEAVDIELAAERINLLETLAARVADRILREPQSQRVFVRIEKLDRGPFSLGVEIVRSRDGLSADDLSKQEAPRPCVAFFANDAIASPHLTGWIDDLIARGAPLILCVGMPAVAPLETGHVMTQRRVDLLAIEQNAWCLAAHDLRCKVVETRTELDWAMKNGQICVWAPSKIVLDAVDGTLATPQDAVAITGWFAGKMSAREMIIIGAHAPETDIPVQVVAVDQPHFL
jgi:dihydroneopterin aldolase